MVALTSVEQNLEIFLSRCHENQIALKPILLKIFMSSLRYMNTEQKIK